MSDSGNIAAMQRELGRQLGRQLAALRRRAGLTQDGLGALAGFSRSAVSLAEIGRQGQARELWQACDKALRSVRDFARKEWPLRGSSADGKR